MLIYDLGGNFDELEVTAVLVDWIECGDGAVFVIKLDGEEIFRSNIKFSYSSPESVKVNISDGQILELITEEGSKSEMDCDVTIWGNPILR